MLFEVAEEVAREEEGLVAVTFAYGFFKLSEVVGGDDLTSSFGLRARMSVQNKKGAVIESEACCRMKVV